MVDGQFDGRHDPAAQLALGYGDGVAAAERKESGYVDVVPFARCRPLTQRTDRAPSQQRRQQLSTRAHPKSALQTNSFCRK